MTASHDFKIGDPVRVVAGERAGAMGRIISILPDPKQKGRDFITIRIKDQVAKVETVSVFPADLRPA